MAYKVDDRRTDTINRHPVARVKLAQFTWASGISSASTVKIPFNGRARVVVGVANNSTNAITYTTTIADEDSYTLYNKTDWPENATTVVTLTSDTEVYIPTNSSVTVTPSGDPGASGGTFDLTIIGF